MKRLLGVQFILPLILLLALALVSGVVPALAQGTYTSSDNGKAIEVKSGDTFTVKLDENPTTGYSWNMTAGNGLQVVNDRYVPEATGLIGSGGYHEWTIKAVKAGTYALSGVYRRPWEPVTGSEQKYSLTVKVSAGQGNSTAKTKFPSFRAMQDIFDFKPKFAYNFGSIFDRMPQFSLFGRL
jgi:inhibitor of cysteine peptidase